MKPKLFGIIALCLAFACTSRAQTTTSYTFGAFPYPHPQYGQGCANILTENNQTVTNSSVCLDNVQNDVQPGFSLYLPDLTLQDCDEVKFGPDTFPKGGNLTTPGTLVQELGPVTCSQSPAYSGNITRNGTVQPRQYCGGNKFCYPIKWTDGYGVIVYQP